MYLQHVLRIHGEIVTDKVAWALTQRFVSLKIPYLYGMLSTENMPNGIQVLSTIRDIHLMQLCFGDELFGRDEGKRVLDRLPSITHSETPEILRLLKQFIPAYLPTDYFDKPDKPYHGLLKPYDEISDPYPCEGQEDRLGREQRTTIFGRFIEALSAFQQNEQLIRLKRLVRVLEIKHLAPIEFGDRESTGYGGFYCSSFRPCFERALRFVHDSTRDMTTYEFSKFVTYLKAKHADFNPLYLDSEEQFHTILDVYREHTDLIDSSDGDIDNSPKHKDEQKPSDHNPKPLDWMADLTDQHPALQELGPRAALVSQQDEAYEQSLHRDAVIVPYIQRLKQSVETLDAELEALGTTAAANLEQLEALQIQLDYNQSRLKQFGNNPRIEAEINKLEADVAALKSTQ